MNKLAPLLAALALASCANLETASKETFSKAFSCPEARVTTRARKDVDAYAATFGQGASPPADVAKDKERLALWKKDQRRNHESWNSAFDVFQVTGCGHEAFYFCGHPNSGQHGERNYADASCSKMSHPPAK